MATEDTKVIENFILKDKGGKGDGVIANKRHGTLIPTYHPDLPLAVRLADSGILANGDSYWGVLKWQGLLLKTLKTSPSQFAMVPFDSIAAAWTDGVNRAWLRCPITAEDLRRDVEIVIPSTGEERREVPEKDQYGRQSTVEIDSLTDSVIRVRDQFYLSGTDETARVPNGKYFMAKLVTDRPPQSYKEAMSMLKPEVVREAEERGANVRRQGEWFAVPTMRTTSQLLADVERGLAVLHEQHILGRNGHHLLEEAVIYRGGPEKGNVYARGMLTHVTGEHYRLDLGFRWHQIVHNIQGASYTLAGNSD